MTHATTSMSRAQRPSETWRTTIRDALVAAGGDQLRRIVLFGSRARGGARANSDLDIVVFVEPPPDVVWGARERAAECRRLRELATPAVAAALGPAVVLDLSVRTLDEDVEACDVVGGVEHWAATTGIVLHKRAPDRVPVPRRRPRDVVRDHTRAWVDFAARTLAHAEEARTRPEFTDSVARAAIIQADVILAVRRACLAVCAERQVAVAPTYKQAPLGATVALMASAAPALAAEVGELLANTVPSSEAGRRVLAHIVAYLSNRDPVLGASFNHGRRDA